MKRLILFLSIATFFALSALAQTPYDNFAPEQSVKSMIEMPETQFKVSNADSSSEISSVEFDKNTMSLNLVNSNDSVLKKVILNPNDKKFTSIDPFAEKNYNISPYAYCNNNPVNYIDPDGRDWYRHNETGNDYWQEGHDQLEGYTNVGHSVSIQLSENSYLNAYQNAGVMSNQAENAFDRIYSSTKLQNQFLGKNSPLSENSKSELMNAINNRFLNNEIGRPVGEALVMVAASELGGALAGKALSWGIGKLAVKVGAKVGEKVISGFTKHGVNQAISRGFKTSDILKIVREGQKVQAVGRYGPQTRYTLGGNTVIVNESGKVISVFSNASGSSQGLGKGAFIPF